jgi:hypothetical protein
VPSGDRRLRIRAGRLSEPVYIRKAVSVGPFRFNLSKGGIGLSPGIKKLRIAPRSTRQLHSYGPASPLLPCFARIARTTTRAHLSSAARCSPGHSADVGSVDSIY